MKRTFIYLALAASVFCACQKENIEPAGSPAAAPAEFVAAMENSGDTKIHLGEYNGALRVLWEAGNEVAVCAGSATSATYIVNDAFDGKPVATLKYSSGGSGTTINHNVALYPVPSEESVTVTSEGDDAYTFNVGFSNYQTYTENSFHDRAFPMVAVSSTSDNILNFKNLAGGVCINLKGTSKISQIVLRSNDEEQLISNTATVKVSDTSVENFVYESSFVETDDSRRIRLATDSPVQLNEDVATPFYIGVAPQEFPSGFNVTLEDSDGFSRTVTTEKAREVKRSEILNMPAITFPFYDNAEWTSLNLGYGNTVYEASTKTLTFSGDYNRWFDLPGVSGDISEHPTLRIWVTSSNVQLKVVVRHQIGDATTITETSTATFSGQTNKIVNSRTQLLAVDLSNRSELTSDMLKNVVSIRISMAGAADGATTPYHMTLDRIVLD